MQRIPQLVAYLDDVLVTGQEMTEHLHVLKHGIESEVPHHKLHSVDYWGYRIDKTLVA